MMIAKIDRSALEHLQSYLFGFDLHACAGDASVQVVVSRPAIGRTVRAELSADEFGSARHRVALARRIARQLNGPAAYPIAA